MQRRSGDGSNTVLGEVGEPMRMLRGVTRTPNLGVRLERELTQLQPPGPI